MFTEFGSESSMPYSYVITATALLRLISLVNSDVAASTAGDPSTNTERLTPSIAVIGDALLFGVYN